MVAIVALVDNRSVRVLCLLHICHAPINAAAIVISVLVENELCQVEAFL